MYKEELGDSKESNLGLFFKGLRKGELPEVVLLPVDKTVDKKETKPQPEKQKFDKHGRSIKWLSIGGVNLLKARAKPKDTPSQAEQQENRVEKQKARDFKP